MRHETALPEAENIRPFGHLSHVMKDHLYWLERGHLFTSPCVSVSISQRFYVMILMTACGSSFRVQCGDFDETVRAVAIAPGEVRKVHAPGMKLISLHLNPLHADFTTFRSLQRVGPCRLNPDAFTPLHAGMDAAYRGALTAEGATVLMDEIASVARQVMLPPRPMDPRISEVLANLDEDCDFSLEDLSARHGLSYHWMSRLFSDTVGLPLRTYCLWLKLQRATQSLLRSPLLLEMVRRDGHLGSAAASGVSLTKLAHDSGFSDSAHMAHTIAELCGGPLSHFLFSGDVHLHVPGSG